MEFMENKTQTGETIFPLPTPEQTEWADAEVGVIIHFDLPSICGHDRDDWPDPPPSPAIFNPQRLDTDQWLKAAHDLGAKYAVLVAKHCSGFSLWPTAAHGYSVKSSPWKGGKGDVVADFIASCEKYGIRPGLYYSVAFNDYLNVGHPGLVRSGDREKQKEYNNVVIQQLTELWTRYGKLFEIWFDGGCLPVEQGGPDVAGLLRRLQPDAVVFQGPEGTKSLVRWCGNERAENSEDCSSIYSYENTDSDGTIDLLELGRGDTNGKDWCPAECDTPNRDPEKSFAGGWFWRDGEEDAVFPASVLFERYLKSVGRNGNLLVGMAIDKDGRFPEKDMGEFQKCGEKIRGIFAKPLSEDFVQTGEDSYEISLPEWTEEKAGYVCVGEDITKGERITGYVLTAYDSAGCEIFRHEGRIISHKRILAVPEGTARARLEILSSKAPVQLRFFHLCRG